MIIAMMYDFDKTLCTKDMQEYGFIPSVGITPNEFWGQCTKMAKEQKMDSILAYMYLMLKKSNDNDKPITRSTFVNAGKNIEFYNGVKTWFKRINEYALSKGVQLEHYIISSGLKEIIEGSEIKDEFKEIYACEFFYNPSGVATWPKMAVNYTAKTQFLFRVNKGVLDVSDDKGLNGYTDDLERRVPFRNMIYIGDGLTDVPCMRLVKANGGKSIAVYKHEKTETAYQLMKDGRVDFATLADYEENNELDTIVKMIIDKMALDNALLIEKQKQLEKL